MDVRLSRRRSPRWTRREVLPALVLSLLLAPVSALAQGADSLMLAWTAPGDDGSTGTAASYEVRVSQSPINANNWSGATVVPSPPAPQSAGTRQSLVVRGLTRGTTYYFAIKATDDANNTAPISNVVRWDWVFDTAPPAAPTGLTASADGNGGAWVEWTPNAEPDLVGYTVYRRLTPTGSFTAINSPSSLGNQFHDSNIPSGTTSVWYQLSATDQTGNESGRSAVFSLSLETQSVASTAWTLESAYPNPSRITGPVSFPVDVPLSGAGSAELHIVNAGGQIIRRIVLNGLGGGPQTVTWDGLNQAGARVSPGVYTAWLVSGSSRRSTKLVRVP